MVVQTLDALVLASLDSDAQIKRIAALWCRAWGPVLPSSRQAAVRWVRREYGPVLNKEMIDHIGTRLVDEIKQQSRLRARRRKLKGPDIPDQPTREERMDRLILSSLGPARVWVPRSRHASSAGIYIGGGFYSGLLAALIPVTMRRGHIVNPNMLVYRGRGQEPKSYWVPGELTSLASVFSWLVPASVKELQALGDVRVEHDGELQAVRVTTSFGTKVVPWRSF